MIAHADFSALRNEYIAESANKLLPVPQEKTEMYKALDASGALFGFGAFDGEKLMGFAFLIAPILPHYGRVIATMESLFIAKKYRKTGAGLRLIREAERCAKELGSPALIISAPVGSVLDIILPRLKYTLTNRAYTKGF